MQNEVQESKYLLVLGPMGCSQLLINQVVRQPRGSSDASEFWDTPIHPFNNQNFAFIHSPGFINHVTLQSILVKLDRHLASDRPRGQPLSLTGIIYVYPEETPDDNTLGPILQTLKAFIGPDYVERVTLYLSPGKESRQGADSKSILESSPAIHSFYANTPEPKMITSSLNRQTINRVLGSYVKLGPCRTYVQNKTAFGEWVDSDILGYLRHHAPDVTVRQEFLSTSNHLPPGPKEHNWSEYADNNPDVEKEEAKLHIPNIDVRMEVQSELAARQDETQEVAYKEEILDLTRKLEQTQAECASLRRYIHPPDMTEEPEIIKILNEINHLIEEVSKSISEYLMDKCAQDGASVDEASSLQRLLTMLGHTEGITLLVTSTTSTRMYPDPGNYFSYFLRALLCGHLYKRLFKPFHPSLVENELENALITEVYKETAYREPQSAVGRWRRDTFRSISRRSTAGRRPRIKSTRQAISEALNSLLKSSFSPIPVDVTLLEEHEVKIDKIVNASEGLNQLVKGSLVFLGEYQPIAFFHGEEFRSIYMSEPCSMFKAIYPNAILATVGLGLIKRYARGGDQNPEEAVILQAIVV
ncbi:hypothetical protein B0J17DRAFT_664954 [Rhizoctonia solani]|nr:hypothetical protein B0J17DRAFT_664954 [Rhizoctonia solani]